MWTLFLAAGVAALAIAAPAAAKPDKGGGGGGGRQAAKVERGGGGGGKARVAKSDRRQARAAKVERRGGGREARSARFERREARPAKLERREARAKRAERRGGEMRFANLRADRGKAEAKARVRSDDRVRGERRIALKERDRQGLKQLRGRDKDRDLLRVRDVAREARAPRRDRETLVARLRDWDDDDRWFEGRRLGFADGCPPGLAAKNPLCMPPGQYKKIPAVGGLLPATYRSNLLPARLRDYYVDDDDYYYRYGDGYLYRVDRDSNLVAALLPLFGAGLGLGQAFPYSFNSPSYYVPSYYQPFYPDTADDYYRYDDGYVYEIDRQTGLIEDIIPMYDHGYGVGQMLPASYSYYNLPYPYRSWYADDDDYYYRYAPGAIYQVDRETQLITAVAALLTGNNALAVGQPLPMGYDVYNVPYAYRSRYYDTPDAWYRYSNGYIYQVDPTTRLITAVLDAIV